MKNILLGLALLLFLPVSYAAKVTAQITIPKLNVAEYHRPYVAIWIENKKRKQVAQITLWLEQEKWHRDLRSWWRRGGKSLKLPVDGVSGATRKPGQHTVSQSIDLPAGDYTINFESVREVGGREYIKIPFSWNGETVSVEKQGKTELGQVRFTIAQN
ncbi:DUF2271 domain-containing protein [Catenovulum sp. SM1970]|uniref:DUF2271 domain-containing protein n=1 Tax=Marinifaba aquimaris TaxID=2741323 RepID=UPI0015718A03|nr:DUF2271 domain-containing protein [Marinifaba aquimaris]NTS78645.1 DUF2271 domain-containing protein [Marinifaba aquimaris]